MPVKLVGPAFRSTEGARSGSSEAGLGEMASVLREVTKANSGEFDV
jgi:hypothetical protein